VLSQKNPKEKLCLLSVLNSTAPRLAGESPRTVATSSNEQSGAELSLLERRVIFKQNLRKTEDSRMEIFERTQEQSDCDLWYKERRGRITGSVCGRIINRNTNIYPTSLLKTLFNSHSDISTAAMVMGKQQEVPILARYIQNKRQNGHPDITTSAAGFLVHKEHGWLGASPDAVVNDGESKGCAEFKAAVSCWEKSLTQAASSSSNFV